jgi:phosphoglycolate phosphatase
MKAVLFWDIDGTLLTTARAGIYALEEALQETTGIDADLQGLRTAGLTDAEVVELALQTAGHEAQSETVANFLRAYEHHLPATLHRREGRVLEGVVDILDDLGKRSDLALYLLTGNTEAGAGAKLRHYGLDRYFQAGGAFCDGRDGRSEIARRAIALADGAELLYLIGDTPHDVRCGKEVGARTVAIASGTHSLEDLAETEPWLLLEQLPEPPLFRRLLELE